MGFVTSAYIKQRLKQVACALRGIAQSSLLVNQNETELDDAMKPLLDSLVICDNEDAGSGDGTDLPPVQPKLLDSVKVQGLLQALIRLLDRSSFAARVTHVPLSDYLRIVL